MRSIDPVLGFSIFYYEIKKLTNRLRENIEEPQFSKSFKVIIFKKISFRRYPSTSALRAYAQDEREGEKTILI